MKITILGLFFCLNFFQSGFAQSNFIDFGNVLSPYPVIGSLEERKDIDQLLFYQKTRTTEQCAAAQAESNHAGLKTFFGGVNGLLSADEVNTVSKKLQKLTAKTAVLIVLYKTKFRRPRPYITHPEIRPCIELESSKAYPSGHTTLARVYARILSVIYPERSMQFIKRSDEVALNRIIGGVHHPSDIVAGKILGDVIADEYLESDD